MATLLNLNPSNSESSKNRQFNMSVFVKEGIQSSLLRKAKNGSSPMRVRILPSFDFSLYGSEQFATSVLPFKAPDLKGITDWAISVKGYIYFGELWNHFLSPATLQPNSTFPKKYTDPVSDLRSFIFQNNKKQTTLSDGFTPLVTSDMMDLIMPDPDTRFTKIPAKPRDFILVNALIENSETKAWEPQVLVMSKQAFGILNDILETRPRKSDPEISKLYPDFLFGDVTDPETGCVLEAREVKTDSNLLALTLCPSSDNKTLIGYTPMPVTEEHLKSRKVLSDPENTIDLKSYQEILDIMCKDPMISTDILTVAFDNQAFNPDAVLNLDLREQGEAELAKRREAIAQKNGGAATGSAPAPKIPSFQQAPKVASVQTTNVMAALANKPTPQPTMPQPVISQVAPAAPQVAIPLAASTVVAQEASQAQHPATVSSSLTPAEQAEYQELLEASTKGGSLRTDQIQRYITLMQKMGGAK